MTGKFKAKSNLSQEDLDFHRIENQDGYITGYYVGGYLVGDVIEATDEYINFEWWCPIDESTLELVEESHYVYAMSPTNGEKVLKWKISDN